MAIYCSSKVKSADQSKNVSFWGGGFLALYMQNVLNHVSDQLSHLAGKCRENVNFQHSVSGIYYTALCYDVIHDVLVLYTFHLLK